MRSMGAMGEKRRDGQSNKDRKLSKTDNKKTVGKFENGTSSIEATKEAVPVVLKLRLFVGGLGPAVGAADLQQRFAPLGTVHKIDLVEGKDGWDAEEALQRGFAYVDFEASSEASLRKLFSAYNGCKWKGGVLRVEKAKEHYMDRLRREWTEAEAEAAVKAKIAEKAAANAISQSRPMYSSQCENVWGSPGSNGFEPEDAIGEEVVADETAVDADEIAAQIEKERKKQLDLLSKLFPEDKDAGDEEEKVIEIVKLRAFPMAADGNGKKRKHGLGNPSESVPVASSTMQTNVEESGVASVPKSPTDVNDKQKAKNRRVKFSEEADARPLESLNDENVTMGSQRKDSTDAENGVRPILKKTLGNVKKMDVDRSEEEDDKEEIEEEYYLSSRSPSPEGGLSDESKWERLFKHAGLKKGPEVTKPSAGVPSTAKSRLSMWTGISLDDDDAEPAVAMIETPQRDAAVSEGLFSGVLSEQEDEESDPPQQTTLGVNAVDSVSLDVIGSDGIFSGILSDSEEEDDDDKDDEDDTDSPQPSMLASKAEDSVALKKSKKMIEEPEMSLDALSDQGDESSELEDADEDLQGIESEEEDQDEDMEDFVDAASTPTLFNEAAKASKWAKMFKSATSVTDPAEGVFSGSLDEADKPVRPRPAEKVQRMFESAAANHTGNVSEAPKVSDNAVDSEVEEDAGRQSAEEDNASTSSDDTPNQDIAEIANNNTAGASEEGGADDQQTGVMGGNLLARFNMERDESNNPSTLEHSTGAQASLSPAKEKVPNSTPQPGGQNVVDDNTKWMQRATWKSLMGADGRASTFALKQVTGEPESTKATEKPAVPDQSLNAFSFNFACNPSEATLSRPKSSNTERAAKKPKAGSAVESKSNKPAKISEDEAGCLFMKSVDAEKEWRASKSELRIDSKAKHKAAVRKMKKMKGSGGAR